MTQPTIYHTQEMSLIRIPVPGVQLEQITIELNNNTLSIKAERELRTGKQLLIGELSTGTWKRSYKLDSSYDPESIEASLRDGFLDLRIQRANQNRVIEVKAA